MDPSPRKPLGLTLEAFPDGRGVGVSAITPESNADQLNRKVCITEEDTGMWILEGDRVIGVNGTETVDAQVEDIARLVGESEGDSVTLTLVRNTRSGPIKVVIMPDKKVATVRRNARLSSAVEFALGREIKYGCIDGWCGTCWHRERTTGWLFKPCSDMITSDWDNVMPMVLFPKPEKAGDATLLQPRGAGASLKGWPLKADFSRKCIQQVHTYTCIHVHICTSVRCTYLYIYMYMYVYMYISEEKYTYIYIYIYVYTYVYVHTYIYIYICMHICVYVTYVPLLIRIYVYMFIRIYIYIYVYIYLYVCIYVYMYICI
ncbi:unnamed protein product [Symbiodinium natans]|uniref:PDZ domain-containing protein n=1 Tax=Symbiodinium natans TaxID=878477 RepID=A0A812SAX0_9DINO|nr:unnamed protein product [Symbiodinium natans]